LEGGTVFTRGQGGRMQKGRTTYPRLIVSVLIEAGGEKILAQHITV
jgi:hypothetical protein